MFSALDQLTRQVCTLGDAGNRGDPEDITTNIVEYWQGKKKPIIIVDFVRAGDE